MATRDGKVKRASLAEFAAVRPSGLIAINLEAGDELGWVRLTPGDSEIVLVTELGQALRFAEATVRSVGRQAGGVAGIRLGDGDHVASMEVVEPGGELVVVTQRGFGKRTPLDEYPQTGRATGGVSTIDQRTLDKTGRIAAARVVQPTDDLTLISSAGLVLRTRVAEVKRQGRSTRGVVLIELKEGDKVASLARIPTEDLRRIGADQNGNRIA
jgi:DNA gyrase subunit A